MRIWIVNPFDNLPIEGNRPQRYWLMARAFAGAGHDVTLWTSAFSHSRKQRRDVGGRGTDFTEDSFRVVLVPTLPYRSNIGPMRLLSHWLLARAWKRRVAEEPVPDLVVASSPPLCLCAAVRRYCRAHDVPFIVDVMDAWPETFERVMPRALLTPLRHMARRNYREAAAISTVAERYVELVRRYGAHAPVRLFYHGIELNPSGVRQAGKDEPISCHLVYAGNMGTSYDLKTVISAARELQDVTLDLAGSGPCERGLRDLAASCPRIRFHGYLGEVELQALLSDADIGVVPMFPESCVGVPYKLADYAAAGLPILNSLTGETARLLAETGAGVSYDAGDISSFREALAALRATDTDRLRDGVNALAARFDAMAIYRDYVAWAQTFGSNRNCELQRKETRLQ